MSLMYLHRSSLMSGTDPPALRPILDSSGVPRAAPRTAGEQMGADSPAGSHSAAHPIIPGPPERLPSRGNPQAASSLVAAVTGDATSLAGGALVICSSDCVLFSGDGAETERERGRGEELSGRTSLTKPVCCVGTATSCLPSLLDRRVRGETGSRKLKSPFGPKQ